MNLRNIDCLAVRDYSTVDNAADNIRVGNFLHLKLNNTIIDKNGGANRYIINQVLVRNSPDAAVAQNLPGGQGE